MEDAGRAGMADAKIGSLMAGAAGKLLHPPSRVHLAPDGEIFVLSAGQGCA
jgi:hypothetical protein